jgi:hypothetical protein
MTIVLLCNFMKVLSMAVSLWAMNDTALVVIGDAVSSFLEEPELVSKGRCLMDGSTPMKSRDGSQGDKWQFKKHFWFHAPSASSFVIWLIL